MNAPTVAPGPDSFIPISSRVKSMKERRSCQKLSLKSGMDPSQSVKCKIVVVGDSQCGKTALLHVFAKDCFPEVRAPIHAGPRARSPGWTHTKTSPGAFPWKRMGEMGDWGRTMHGSMFALGRGVTPVEPPKPDCGLSTFFLFLMLGLCVFCRATSPLCLRTTPPALRLTLRGSSSACGTPQVTCALRCLFCVLTFACAVVRTCCSNPPLTPLDTQTPPSQKLFEYVFVHYFLSKW